MPLIRTGRDTIAQLIVAAGSADTKKYDSTGAVIWISSSTAAHNAATTWLDSVGVAATMEAAFPSRAANVLQFRGVYTTAMANFQWEQWSIGNATQSDSGNLLNKAVQQVLGAKTSAGIWTLTACMTITT